MSQLRAARRPDFVIVCRTLLITLGGIVASLLLCLPLFGQANLGRILGVVTDQSGAVITGATVTVTDTQRGVSRTLTTDTSGEYIAPSLLAGSYAVRAEAKGFTTLNRQNIALEVGKDVRVDLSLQPGEQSQTVTVTEAVPMIDTTSATLGGTLSNESIEDLPLNGRNYQYLLTLRPGVTIYPGGGPWTQSTNGVRPDDMVYLVDGVLNDNFFDGRSMINMTSPTTDAATILPVDGIQEMNTEVNPKAEDGFKPGATVNIGLKSGTNALHGTGFAFGRDQSWDARNYFIPAPTNGTCIVGGTAVLLAQCDQPPLNLKQFGGTVGGPIKKDKLFFFGSYEGLRSLVGSPTTIPVPETSAQPTADPKHSLPDAIAALNARGIPLSAVSLGLVGCTAAGACNGPSALIPVNNSNSPIVATDFPNTNSSNNYLIKIDYHINDKNTLNGMFYDSHYAGSGENRNYTDPVFDASFPVATWVNSYNWTWTPNSRWLNEARFGVSYMMANIVQGDINKPATAYGLNTGVTNPTLFGLPSLNIKGFNPIGTFSGTPKLIGPLYNYDFTDDVSYLRGRHAFKFGGEFIEMKVTAGTFRTGRGLFKFNGNKTFAGSTPLEDFLAGSPFQGQLLNGSPLRHLSMKYYAGFVQDDWRIKPRVTVNLGVRYEYLTPPTAEGNLLGNFDPNAGLVQVGNQISTPWNPDHKAFSPRVGVAWDLTGNGTTVLRAGASMIHDMLNVDSFVAQQGMQNASTLGLSAIPTGACATSPAPGQPCPQNYGGNIAVAALSFPGSQLKWPAASGSSTPIFPPGVVSCTASSPCNIMGVQRNFATPYVTTWTLGVQHAFTKNLSLEMSYVGNHGSQLPGVIDINQPALGTGVMPFGSKFPYLGIINWLENLDISNYHGLQATLTQRVSHGLSFTLGYTWSHALDDNSANWAQLIPQDSTRPLADYASSDFDIRHRFTFSATYQIPGMKSPGQLLEGWKINTILTIQSPQPWLVDDSTNNFSGTGESTDRWDFFGNPSDFKSKGQNSIPYCSGFGGAVTCSQSTQGGPITFSPQQTSAMAQLCNTHAPDAGTLATGGCFVSGNSVMVPPLLNTFGTMGRNIFRDTGFQNLDASLAKDWKFRERLNAEFRLEFFNVLNHPNFANPFGGPSANGVGFDPSATSSFGCGCQTPDIMAGNFIIGSGSARAMQLGLKLTF